MNRSLNRVNHTLKALLCIALILQLQFLTSGCGVSVVPSSGTDGWMSIDLSPGHPLNQALTDSRFADASAIEVNPKMQIFRFVFPDESRGITGQYEFVNGEFTVRQFHMQTADGSVTMQLNESKQVTSITTSGGESWSRADESVARVKTSAPGVNGYMEANADLMDIAAEIDQQGAATEGQATGTGGTVTSPSADTPTVLKSNVALDSGVRTVLVLLAAVWAPLFGVLNSLVSFFTIGVIIDGLLATRLDGQWSATNAQSNLLLTISAGRIVQIVETAGDQEFDLKESTIETNTGTRVVWKVIATVPGQALEVEFQFDMQEVDRDNLEGTLTAMGDTFARVAMTMTRM